MSLKPNSRWTIPVAAFAVLFGTATILAGGRALSGSAASGNVVPFVLWFNFIAGFFYVVAGIGIGAGRAWAHGISVLIAASSALVGVALAAHIASGGAFEVRTAVAMPLRCVVWTAIAVMSRRKLASGNVRA